MMTNEKRQLIRNSILRMLEAAPVNGLAVSMLSIGLQSRGLRDIEDADIKAELQYLADKGFVARVPQKISPELAPWRITAEGRDELAS
jgi:hypothetical protein